MKKEIQLNLFLGQVPNKQFFEDLSFLKNFKEKEIFDIIDKTIEWYPERFEDKDWKKWLASFNNEEEKIKGLIRVFLFMFKEIVCGNIHDKELKSDIKKISLPKKYADYFTKKLKSAKEFEKEVLKSKRPDEDILVNLAWRIDTKHYNDGEREDICVLELVYYHLGDEKKVKFDLNLIAMRHFIYELNKIEKKLCGMN